MVKRFTRTNVRFILGQLAIEAQAADNPAKRTRFLGALAVVKNNSRWQIDMNTKMEAEFLLDFLTDVDGVQFETQLLIKSVVKSLHELQNVKKAIRECKYTLLQSPYKKQQKTQQKTRLNKKKKQIQKNVNFQLLKVSFYHKLKKK